MSDDTTAEAFEAERSRLRALAYQMLGTPDDSDDIVQDAWLRFAAADHSTIENPAAWLTTVTSRLAIDKLRSAQSRRETYVGPWLSEPLFEQTASEPGPDEALVLSESLTLGFLAMLERLSPLERAVFILSELFGYRLAEVAAIVERSDAATRQLAKRARDHIAEERPRFAPEPDDIEELSAKVMAAAMEGDLETLTSYLADDIVHLSDGGPDYRAARHPISGPERVARFFIGLTKRFEPGMEIHEVRANGQSAIYLTLDGEPFMLSVANWVDAKMTANIIIRNPDKLASFHTAWRASL